MDYNSRNGQTLHRNHNHRSRNQSFSSALLAAISKSTDDDRETMGYKKSRSQVETRNVEAEINRFGRNSRFETQRDEDPWLNNEKSVRGESAKMGAFKAKKYEAEAAYTRSRSELHLSFRSNMSSATSYSSEYRRDKSSISCPYFSSDAESLYTHRSSIPTVNKTHRNSHHVAGRGDKACKWTVGADCSRDLQGKSLVKDGGFRFKEKSFIAADHHAKIKSKSKPGKNSEKPKQPISPGRKLAVFFNSLFMSSFTKKVKISSFSSVTDSNSCDSSERKTASIYSSYSSVQSRPCLSKISRGLNNHKSVTFCPTSVIVDENPQPCVEKCHQKMEKYRQITHPDTNPNPSNYSQIMHRSVDRYKLPLVSKEFKQHISEEERHAAAAATAKEIIAKYQKRNNKMETVVKRSPVKPVEVEEEDDASSCSSSELFELKNLATSDMKMDLYKIEHPVYETTHFVTNKAMAQGLTL